MELPKAEELKKDIHQWVSGADKYNYALDSEKEFITNEILKLVTNYTSQLLRYAAEKGSYKSYGLSVVDKESILSIIKEINEIVESVKE